MVIVTAYCDMEIGSSIPPRGIDEPLDLMTPNLIIIVMELTDCYGAAVFPLT